VRPVNKNDTLAVRIAAPDARDFQDSVDILSR
jgi:hypothetical protein